MDSKYAQFILPLHPVNIQRPSGGKPWKIMSLTNINDIFLCNIMNRDLLLYVGVIAELDRAQLNKSHDANSQSNNQVNLTDSIVSQQSVQ